MLKIKSFTLAIFFGVAAVGLPISSARAILTELDLNTSGDKLITVDSVTGLQWLDITATQGQSYTESLSDPDVLAGGFRHATRDEVATLFINSGVADFSNTFQASNFLGAIDLQSKIGVTGFVLISGQPSRPVTQGFSDFDPFSNFTDVVRLVSRTDREFTARALIENTPRPKTNKFDSYGNYYLRVAPVPEPASVLLFGVGLAGLAWIRRRRSR
ncbi:MAG: VPLPA-CTERM sorting domain-containing protein [Alphaproteobacteria bacterium]|jgi:hypothetical protein|nr:VPLPA-CTERM sorting domain-containing protein [Alphaproteobacteria bacterium]MDP6517393.1 VPLPA-CTERM sorting domain-containing protein [Alphaproteobacteria bacterium]|tara:strand:+ start:95 stop:739 length:645 start_codon:yes stop_codon:yes gene_type:complete